MKVSMFRAEIKIFGWKNRTYSNDIWMAQSKEQSNLRSELLLKQNSQVLILLRLTHQLNCNIHVLVDASVDPAMPARGKF